MADPMDPESSDSEVSAGGGAEYRFAGPLTAPIPLPAPASKHALESPDAVQSRLDELQRVEEHNIKKYELLKAKRARKDDKIRRKRDLQDKKLAAIYEARQRRDARIQARRKREDAAFSHFFDQDLDEEETNLRRRLKRLKRGLPLDESPKSSHQNVSSTSMTSPGSSLSTNPPPPKRHQVGPPGHPDAVNPAQSKASTQAGLPAASKNPAPSTGFGLYRDPINSYSRPFQHSSPYSSRPDTASPIVTSTPSSRDGHDRDHSHQSHPGPSASPVARPPPPTQSPGMSATSATSGAQPRPPSSSYDTRPPPTTASSSFAPINAPATSGFATINPKTTATPPASHVTLPRPLSNPDVAKPPSHPIVSNGMDHTMFHAYSGAPSNGSSASSSIPSKRTPSTTHPYQMSEAFANRHHHCERVDALSRGIWTSFGVGGTQDNPTGPPVEMYLRCNHDGCSRIDWRTVHGLQCHIVKSHFQPKGTIGSLEKALEKYGVPVKEVEEYERIHGRGAAGTMADPKNHKIKTKTREAVGGSPKDSRPNPGAYDPDARPAGYRPSPPSTTQSPTGPDAAPKSPLQMTMKIVTNGLPKGTPVNNTAANAATIASPGLPPPRNSFTSVQSDWLGSKPTSHAPKMEVDTKKLQGDFGKAETQSKDQLPPSRPGWQAGIFSGSHAPNVLKSQGTPPPDRSLGKPAHESSKHASLLNQPTQNAATSTPSRLLTSVLPPHKAVSGQPAPPAQTTQAQATPAAPVFVPAQSAPPVPPVSSAPAGPPARPGPTLQSIQATQPTQLAQPAPNAQSHQASQPAEPAPKYQPVLSAPSAQPPPSARLAEPASNPQPAPKSQPGQPVEPRPAPLEMQKAPQYSELQLPPISAKNPAPASAKADTVELKGVPVAAEKPETHANGAAAEVHLVDEHGSPPIDEDSLDHAETIVVVEKGSKDASMRPGSAQPPTLTNKSNVSTMPVFGRRLSRRSSAARTTADGESDMGYLKEGKGSAHAENDDKDDKEREERENARPEPRRSLTGRILRRGRA